MKLRFLLKLAILQSDLHLTLRYFDSNLRSYNFNLFLVLPCSLFLVLLPVKMPVTCIVVNCTNRAGRDENRFFRIPAIITNQDSRTQELTETRRRSWFAAIRRQGLEDKQLQHMRVCNDHFLSGRPNEIIL